MRNPCKGTTLSSEPAPPVFDHQPRWSNCLFWAARQLLRHGGYGLIRRGHHGVPFHVLWMPPGTFEPTNERLTVWSYEPLKPHWRLRDWRRDLLLFFRGHIVQGDAELDVPNTYVDPVTGLFNRRYLSVHLDKEIARAKRYDLPLSVLLIAIDQFDGLNTRYGQQFGEDVLRGMAKIIIETTRPSDTGIRYSRGEFLVIVPETDADGARILTERLRRKIQDMTVPSGPGTSVTIEMNASAASLRSTDGYTDDLIARVDPAYQPSTKSAFADRPGDTAGAPIFGA
jgi:diguanylate cyclase (GGDEF)-like protein